MIQPKADTEESISLHAPKLFSMGVSPHQGRAQLWEGDGGSTAALSP